MTAGRNAIAVRGLCALWLIAALACSDDSGAPAPAAPAAGAGMGAAGSAAPAVTFTQVYSMLFPRSSSGQCEMCHGLPAHDVVNGNLSTGMTQATTYAALVGKNSQSSRCMSLPLVMPFQPDMSLLYLKLTTSPPCGVRMPNGGAGLADAQIEMVRSWIAGGAKDD